MMVITRGMMVMMDMMVVRAITRGMMVMIAETIGITRVMMGMRKRLIV